MPSPPASTNNRNDAKDTRTSASYYNNGKLLVQSAYTSATAFDPISFDYNAFGEETWRESPTVNSAKRLLQTTYDRRGLQTQQRDDSGTGGINVSNTLTYDAFGRVTRTTDPRGVTRTQSFDRAGRVVQVTDGLGKGQFFTFDAFSRELTRTDKRGNVTRTTYASNGRETVLLTPESVRVVTVRNAHGETIELWDGNGSATTYKYDQDGALRYTTQAAGTASTALNLVTERRYDKAGRVNETVDARGVRTSYTYDAANRVLTRVEDLVGLKLRTQYSFDGKGQQITQTAPDGTVTQTSYDLKGQKVLVAVDPSGLNLRTQFAYDRRGKTLQVREGYGTAGEKVTEYTYDALGRMTQSMVDPAGLRRTTDYRYGATGNVLTRVDANGNITAYSYDLENREIYALHPTGALTETVYDADGLAHHDHPVRHLANCTAARQRGGVGRRGRCSQHCQRRQPRSRADAGL